MKNQKSDPKGSKQFFGAVTPVPNIPKEKTPEQAEFDAHFSGPYDNEGPNPLIKVGLRLTTPTCPPLPEELESKVHETLVNYAPGEVVASFANYPHSFCFVTYPSGKKFEISR